MALAKSATEFAIGLLILGSFASIYHPVGAAMLAASAPSGRLGQTLGRNGVWGNLGVAFAPMVTATLASAFGWQAAFLAPALAAFAAGVAFVLWIPPDGVSAIVSRPPQVRGRLHPRHRWLLFIAFAVAVATGGATFSILTISLPKVIDERLLLSLPAWAIGSIATIALLFGALAQTGVGRLIESVPLPRLFALISLMQPVGFAIASVATGMPLLIGLVFVIASSYANVVVMDAIVARYVRDEIRSRIYGLRYFLGFSVSGLGVAPLIGWLHTLGGFPLLLGVTASIAVVLGVSAVAVWGIMDPSPSEV